ITTLRRWLADQRSLGAGRSTLARRAAVARAFTAWAHRDGRLGSDVGAGLGSPRVQRPLPRVLRSDQASTLVTALADEPVTVRGTAHALALRDRLVLELLYATGVRVAELCGLNLPDVDRERRVVRVLGKGGTERAVPYGQPAES